MELLYCFQRQEFWQAFTLWIFSVREDYRRCNRWNERLIKKGAEKYYEKTGISSYGSWNGKPLRRSETDRSY